MPPKLWALLISISTYASPEHEDLDGSPHDSMRLRAYLENTFQVPPSQIRMLQNTQATRAGILGAFRDHLLDNPNVTKGDRVVIAYSGHGGRVAAPGGWLVAEDHEGKRTMEMIIPYDEGTKDASGNLVCGIPDRTLGVLLSRLAEKAGNNITVILDCCSSGHGTRDRPKQKFWSSFKTRTINPANATPLRADLDADIYALEPQGARDRARPLRGAFTQHRAKSHVLLAACASHEQAIDVDDDIPLPIRYIIPKGGLFTTFLLKSLQDTSIRPRTYAEIMKHVGRSFDALKALDTENDVEWQHPQCEGVARDRLVFDDVMMDSKLFGVTNADGGLCRVEAGEIQGVSKGTLFELYEMTDDLNKKATVGTAVAEHVYPAYSLARIPKSLELGGEDVYTALVAQEPYRLRFTVLNTEPESADAAKSLVQLEASLEDGNNRRARVLSRVGLGTEGLDLVLEVDGRDGGGITLVRQDIHLRDLDIRHPRLNAADIEVADFPRILDAIARFNFYLSQSSKAKPFDGDVDLEFHLLEPDHHHEPYDAFLHGVRALRKEILFRNDEATIIEGQMDDYAFVLRNDSDVNLFPYLVYFDTGTYQIDTWYKPFEADKPTLLAGQTLQIGASPEHSPPFDFYIPEGNVDTSFVKVFLLETEAQMGFMDQPPVVGFDEDGGSYVRAGRRAPVAEEGIEVPPRRGGWDCITRKITVKRS